jgi:sec-independent protein translocase protein TatC
MPATQFDPDDYRMTVGEHLEELRSRLVWSLLGYAILLILCLVFARDHVLPWFCAPLFETLQKYDINPQLVADEVSEGFMVYLQVSMICAAAFAGPWILYQLWQFVAAGLYPKERKYVTKYLPLSITLLISGMLLVYFFVLPWTLDFFIGFSIGIPIPGQSHVVTTAPTSQPALIVPSFPGEPEKKLERMMWFDESIQQLKFVYRNKVRVISFGSSELLRPEITIDKYIDLVISMLISFGLAFQLPLVVLALAKIGIVEVSALKAGRRYVYFAMSIVAAVITPGDVITATVALMVPLILLYELGIWLARGTESTWERDTSERSE